MPQYKIGDLVRHRVLNLAGDDYEHFICVVVKVSKAIITGGQIYSLRYPNGNIGGSFECDMELIKSA